MAAPMVSANEYDTQIDEAKKQVKKQDTTGLLR